jgi:Fe2+ transport system protein FeoA
VHAVATFQGKAILIEAANLAELHEGERATIDALDLPEELGRRMMELGFLPGAVVVAGKSAPGGDPRVYFVDGAEIALRRDTARRVLLHPLLKERM